MNWMMIFVSGKATKGRQIMVMRTTIIMVMIMMMTNAHKQKHSARGALKIIPGLLCDERNK